VEDGLQPASALVNPSSTAPPTGAHVVERCFARLDQFRAVATRFDESATPYRGIIDLDALLCRS
jgi:hypothetical protein